MTKKAAEIVLKAEEIVFYGGLSLFGAFGLAKALSPKKTYISADLEVEPLSGLEKKEEE